MKIYTRTGDQGETGLFGGPRVGKDSLRIETYGTVDHLNAVLGLARSEPLSADVDEVLATTQNHLFDLGAELATPDPQAHGTAIITETQISWQEAQIDHFEEMLEPLKAFILPGGTRGAAQVHVARCVCRRAERLIVALSRVETISPQMIAYANRLSDLLFVLARAINHQAGVADVPWQRGS
jgi:cob(I)alamin adenosyltransferase